MTMFLRITRSLLSSLLNVICISHCRVILALYNAIKISNVENTLMDAQVPQAHKMSAVLRNSRNIRICMGTERVNSRS